MLGPFRKFSSSIYAKILLGIVVIPFVFWGMGSSFKGGNKNIIVTIDKEKYSVQDFSAFMQRTIPATERVLPSQIEQYLSMYIGEKLIENEVEYFDIILSDLSLSQLIKHQKEFERDNEFSRMEYEKFLLEKNITAASFEKNLSRYEKKKQLIQFIGGGIIPSDFLINLTFNQINQKRNIELINLNNVFKKNLSLTEDEIKNFYNNNADKYNVVYKSLKILELNPKNLTNEDSFNDLFFERIDEIDNMVVRGEDLDSIKASFNLDGDITLTFDAEGKDTNSKAINNISKKLVDDIFKLNEFESINLIEDNEKYFIVEVIKTETLQKNIENESVKKDIIKSLESSKKRKVISELIGKINNNNFKKSDFNKLSKDENVPIQKISLKNLNDDKILKKELVSEIYKFSEKKIIVINDMYLTESYLIYIKEIENVSINNNSKDWEKYLMISRNKIINNLYNSYDDYIRAKYEIEINYKTLEAIKNNFSQ